MHSISKKTKTPCGTSANKTHPGEDSCRVCLITSSKRAASPRCRRYAMTTGSVTAPGAISCNSQAREHQPHPVTNTIATPAGAGSDSPASVPPPPARRGSRDMPPDGDISPAASDAPWDGDDVIQRPPGVDTGRSSDSRPPLIGACVLAARGLPYLRSESPRTAEKRRLQVRCLEIFLLFSHVATLLSCSWHCLTSSMCS